MVEASYSHRVDGAELVDHRRTIQLHREACEIFDNYPWESELKMTEETGEGGGLCFWIGDLKDKHASFQFVPVDTDKGFLMLSIVAKKGTLGVFGKKAVDVDFDEITILDAKDKIKDLFSHSIESLYDKYKG